MTASCAGRVAGIGALADRCAAGSTCTSCSQPEPVSRDQAAAGGRRARHRPSSTSTGWRPRDCWRPSSRRLGGRSGPGAGRTSKLYRRAGREIAVSLPDREYELAGRLLADAIAESVPSGEPVLDALHRLAADHGRPSAARRGRGGPAHRVGAVRAGRLAIAVLAEHGYEPRAEDGRGAAGQLPVPRAGPGADRAGLPDERGPGRRAGGRPGRASCGAAGPGRRALFVVLDTA